MKHFVSATVIAIGFTGIAAPVAQAFSLNSSLDCSAGTLTGSSKCAGSYQLGKGENDVTNGDAKNIVTRLLNKDDVFDVGGNWQFGNKFDGGMSANNADGFSVSGLGDKSGSISFDALDLSKNDVAISLKAGKGFSLYYIKAGSITDPNQIQWDTSGTATNKKGKAKDLSHISYFTRFVDTTPKDKKCRIPESSSAVAILAIGLGIAFHRRQKGIS